MSILSTQPDFLAVFEYGWEWRVKETEPELARYLSLLSGFGKLSRAASCKQVAPLTMEVTALWCVLLPGNFSLLRGSQEILCPGNWLFCLQRPGELPGGTDILTWLLWQLSLCWRFSDSGYRQMSLAFHTKTFKYTQIDSGSLISLRKGKSLSNSYEIKRWSKFKFK